MPLIGSTFWRMKSEQKFVNSHERAKLAVFDPFALVLGVLDGVVRILHGRPVVRDARPLIPILEPLARVPQRQEVVGDVVAARQKIPVSPQTVHRMDSSPFPAIPDGGAVARGVPGLAWRRG
jgi:hypothetical protein